MLTDLIPTGNCSAERRGAGVLREGLPCPGVIFMWVVVASALGGGGGEPRASPEDAAPCLSPGPPQAPAGQRQLPAPGLPEGAPAPGPARCRPLGPQALEKLREPVMSVAMTARGHSPLCWMEMTSGQ